MSLTFKFVEDVVNFMFHETDSDAVSLKVVKLKDFSIAISTLKSNDNVLFSYIKKTTTEYSL